MRCQFYVFSTRRDKTLCSLQYYILKLSFNITLYINSRAFLFFIGFTYLFFCFNIYISKLSHQNQFSSIIHIYDYNPLIEPTLIVARYVFAICKSATESRWSRAEQRLKRAHRRTSSGRSHPVGLKVDKSATIIRHFHP